MKIKYHLVDVDAVQEELEARQKTRELVKLVRKLHWIGLDDEAERLEHALGMIPASERPCVLDVPATD